MIGVDVLCTVLSAGRVLGTYTLSSYLERLEV
jgi:hypothetical protein